MQLRKKYKYLFACMCITVLHFSKVVAQQASYISNNYYHEKIYVHSDKDLYIAGEIIWFKIYNVSEDSLKLSKLSTVAYVELMNGENKPVLQAKVRLENGCGNGSFFVPTTVNSGNYILRAYTNWMKNFEEHLFFRKSIKIINTLKPIDDIINDTTQQVFIDFMPEGGNLVNGIKSEIGFKVTDNNGKGISATGNIVDNNNNNVATFSTYKFGLGTFSFKPEASKQYKAIIQVAGKSIEKPIVAALNNGYVLHVSDTEKENLQAIIKTNSNTQLPVYLIAYNNQKIYYSTQKNLNENDEAAFIIGKQNLPYGITHIVLFDNNKQPVCERLYFKQPKLSNLAIHIDSNEYAKRSKVNLNIASENNAHLSMSVFLNDSLQTTSDNNIQTYYWLTSSLNGYVESAATYFNDSAQVESAALKNLLLTQGWSRFMQSSAQNKQPVLSFLPEHEGQIIKGKITDKSTGAPVKNVMVYLTVPGKNFQLATSKSDINGNILFDVKGFYGDDEIVLQTMNSDSNYQFSITDPFLPDTGTYQSKNISFRIEKQNLNLLQQYNIYMQAQNAYYDDQLKTFSSSYIDTLPFYGDADAKYLLDNYTRFTTMEEVLREYVRLVGVIKKDENYNLTVTDTRNYSVYKNHVLVLFDGVPEFDMNKVISYNPLKIKKIEVVAKEYYLNNLTADGIISFRTYNGDLDGFKFNAHTVELSYEGLQLQREFYSPEYITDTEKSSRKPDFRNVLYWQPDINTDKNNPSLQSFFSSDLKGKFTAVVEGVDDSGNAVYNTANFQVK